jgi:peptidoglycan/xylan/chitin deacetylase (PgdA/CDA1 family)
MVEAHRDGHLIAGHSFSHRSLPTLNSSDLLWELTASEDLISSWIKEAPVWIRPPFGDVDARTGAVLRDFGQKIGTFCRDTRDHLQRWLIFLPLSAAWNYDSQDTNGMSGQSLTDHVLNRARTAIPPAGSSTAGIMALFHDTKPETAKFIREFVDIVRAKGYTFVSLDQCAGTSAELNYKPRQDESLSEATPRVSDAVISVCSSATILGLALVATLFHLFM